MTYRDRLRENYPQLSAGQKKVAKVFFESPELIAFTPAFEIGRNVGVSESTVIRLTQSLGYKGYAELQEIVQQELQDGRTLSQHQTITEVGSEGPFYNKLFQEDIRNMERTMQMLKQSDFEKAVKLISNAAKIFVVGSLSSQSMASYLAHWLNMFFQNTNLLSEKDMQYYTQLSQIDDNSLVIPITFPRYVKSTIQLAEYTKVQGSKILSITDSELSPIREFSDIMLISPISTEIKIDSYTAPLALINSLIRSVAIANDKQVEKSLRKIEQILHDNQVFYK